MKLKFAMLFGALVIVASTGLQAQVGKERPRVEATEATRERAAPSREQAEATRAGQGRGGGAPVVTSGKGGTNPDKCIAVAARDVDRCHGSWSVTDNTGNWNYYAQTGYDQFVHKNGKKNRACKECPNGGSIKVDFAGLEDHCAYDGSAAIGVPGCASGTLVDVPGGVDRCVTAPTTEPCHGNWAVTDNTGHYARKTVGGPDSFWHNSDADRNRTCSKCPNGGSIRVDYLGGTADMCVTDHPSVPVKCAGGAVQAL